MAYWRKDYYCGKVRETIKYHRYDAVGVSTVRMPKRNLTTEAQKKINEKNAFDKLRRLINTNFGHKDLWLSFTYRQRPDPETAKADFEKRFLKNLRRAYKRAGSELKYIHILEVGETGAVHHHMLVNNIDPAIIARLWDKGFLDIKFLDDSGQYEKIAKYMIKFTAKNYDDPEKTFCNQRYSCSKNLKQPRVTVQKIKYDSWKEEPVPAKGYKITECYCGVNDFTGYPYQFYSMVEIPLYRGYVTTEELQEMPRKMKRPYRRRPGASHKQDYKAPETDLFCEVKP